MAIPRRHVPEKAENLQRTHPAACAVLRKRCLHLSSLTRFELFTSDKDTLLDGIMIIDYRYEFDVDPMNSMQAACFDVVRCVL